MSVEYQVNDGCAVFTLDNGPLNVANMAMHKSFYKHFLEFQQDDAATVGVIVGAGDNFCAGDDLKEIRTEAWALTSTRWDHLLWEARRSKPMVAAMRGYALGAGFLYATLMCDIRIAGESLKIGTPEIAYGMGGISGVTRLGLHLPPVHAAYLALTGEKIDAHRARDIFLVNEVVADAEVLNRAMEVASMIAAHPLPAVKVELDCLHRGMELSRADACHYSQQQYWLSRQLLGDDSNTGTEALATMKSKREKDND
ncbi:enoyl-CoA hydratase/isomerase family protein [Halieaceae bacterium IMCC14734]|uniref:Enoyl-CoA hydratase/isomerase family protein n=1 Tax=Candidatus Litorirhabdus singularis TaxID=2518993 RepID=A0ABT3TF82_9GAMM|nr:enoyl-CoA hydratase/isomerase family protein [Candidatus Litorirhabdus singularis]MCX2980850.1 enoyl-CoA hydratase/isomerase family protein [Candidatus Litorirhabdus singularis]